LGFFFLGGGGGGGERRVRGGRVVAEKMIEGSHAHRCSLFFLSRSLSLPLLPIRARRHRLRLECACRAREKVGAWAHRELACSLEEKASRKLFFRRPPQARSRVLARSIPALSRPRSLACKRPQTTPFPESAHTNQKHRILTSSRCGPRPALAASADRCCCCFPRCGDATTTRRPILPPRASTPCPCERRWRKRRRWPAPPPRKKRPGCCARGRAPRGHPWRGGKRTWLKTFFYRFTLKNVTRVEEEASQCRTPPPHFPPQRSALFPSTAGPL